MKGRKFMKRLTCRDSDGRVCRTSCTISDGDAWERLADFEDIGAEPNEIISILEGKMQNVTFDVGSDMYELAISKVFERTYGVTLARMCELAEADKDERCVVIPCKVDDTVWVLIGNTIEQCHVTVCNCHTNLQL